MKNMIEEKNWDAFRATGLLWFVNQLLHAFGWAIVINIDEETGVVQNAFPARVKFRGFDEKSQTDGYTKLTEYVHREADDLLHDVYGTEK